MKKFVLNWSDNAENSHDAKAFIKELQEKVRFKTLFFCLCFKSDKILLNSFFYVIPQGYENEEEEELDVVEGLEALVGVIFLLLLN